MYKLVIPALELWDEQKQEFVIIKEHVLMLEHSLVSLSKWESKWNKPFLTKDKKTFDETLDYIKCMTVTQNVDDDIYNYISQKEINNIIEYMNKPMTAAWFPDDKRGRTNREQVTADLIYYWMIALAIPSEYQKWHLNRLLTLIKVCNIKNQPNKKMSRKEILSQNAALNAARKQQLNTKG